MRMAGLRDVTKGKRHSESLDTGFCYAKSGLARGRSLHVGGVVGHDIARSATHRRQTSATLDVGEPRRLLAHDPNQTVHRVLHTARRAYLLMALFAVHLGEIETGTARIARLRHLKRKANGSTHVQLHRHSWRQAKFRGIFRLARIPRAVIFSLKIRRRRLGGNRF